jgi:hypothetical protein
VPTPSVSQVMTASIDGSQPIWLGTLGHISGLTWSFACPGGCDQMSCTLTVPASFKSAAIQAGRTVSVYRGAQVAWNGTLLEPAPTPGGWALTAVGSGNFGTNYAAIYNTWNNNPDEAVNQAIGRGLAWSNPGIGSPDGMWLGQRVDPGAQTITDLLNLVCTRGGLVWQVSRRNVLTVSPLPATVSRLLVSNTPVARTLGGYLNTVWIRYNAFSPQQFGHPVQSNTTFKTTSVVNQASIDTHGPLETFLDLSSAGFPLLPVSVFGNISVLTEAQAQAVGNFVLQRYEGASFAGPFTVSPSQLLTTGGTPVDLGMQRAGLVCQLILTDYGYGGEVNNTPVTFLAGGYEYDDDAQTGTVTPFQNLRTDIQSLLSVAAGQRGRGVGDWQRR